MLVPRRPGGVGVSLAVEGPFCCALGCREDADVVVKHPDHGERTVCADHAGEFEVVREVSADV